MIHLTKIIPSWLGINQQIDLFGSDFRQFKAIHAQVRMLFCTEPLHPWAVIEWRRNFAGFLKQTLRQAHHCLEKCITLTEQTSPPFSENLARFWRDLSPLIFQANLIISTGILKPDGQSNS